MSTQGEKVERGYFTSFDGRLKARLARVIPARSPQLQAEGRFSGISARYDCRIKIEYQQDIMRLLEEGMLVAVRNFKSRPDLERFTLLEISRIMPEHFGLRGITDQSYYPMQFEIIEEAVPDWGTDDRSSMIVQASAIPVNYDLVITPSGPEFAKGFSYPVLGEEALVLSSEMIDKMYNESVLKRMGWTRSDSDEPRSSPRIGTVRMFLSREGEEIPIYLDLESLVRYHFGVFAFTGGGKSNLLANILRRVLLHLPDSKVVVFDISSEYPFLLADILSDERIPSLLLMESRATDPERLFNAVVKPKVFEEERRSMPLFARMLELGRVATYVEPPKYEMPTYGGMLSELSSIGGSVDSPAGQAAQEIRLRILTRMKKVEAADDDVPDDSSAVAIAEEAEMVLEERGLRRGSTLHNWAAATKRLPELVRMASEHSWMPGETECTLEMICNAIDGDTRLLCLSISEPDAIKRLAIEVTSEMLRRRRNQFKVKPYVLFVFDEAQEFIPSQSTPGLDGACSKNIERLLRQGRKYGLGACISTQRIAYLNTSALQQLHTYFVGTLPRPYDRTVVSDVFAVDLGILEKTLEFAPGDWLLSSYTSTGIRNVPIFVHADDSEITIRRAIGGGDLPPGEGG